MNPTETTSNNQETPTGENSTKQSPVETQQPVTSETPTGVDTQASSNTQSSSKAEVRPEKVLKCSYQTCKRPNKFVKVEKNIWVCMLHAVPHICGDCKVICDFAQTTGQGNHQCWATGITYFGTAENEESKRDANVATASVTGSSRKRLITVTYADGTTEEVAVDVPWGLDTGTAIPEIEESGFAQLCKRNFNHHHNQLTHKLKSDKKKRKLDEGMEIHDAPTVYHTYIGMLAHENVDDDLGDYLTLHHGRMGENEGGVGYEGVEDDQDEMDLAFTGEKEATLEVLEDAGKTSFHASLIGTTSQTRRMLIGKDNDDY